MESIFLKYLRSLYSSDSGVSITIRAGRGGGVRSIVIDAAKEFAQLDRRVVVVDCDRGSKEMNLARKEAKEKEIEMLENHPCLEATLLAILNHGKKYEDKSSAWCKKELYKYIDEKKCTDSPSYLKVFPKKLLDTERVNVLELDRLISLMEGNW